MSKNRAVNPEEDATDPYILGQPMGWLGTTIFCLIMFGGVVFALYEVIVKGALR